MTNNLAIIGSGPAAWAATIYAARALLLPVVLAGQESGGQLMLTTAVENYPGFPDGIQGPDLMQRMRTQAEKLGVHIVNKDAAALSKTPTGEFQIAVPGAATSPDPDSGYTARAVIIATGAKAQTLKLPGEDRLMGRGVGTCAVCDAPFYKGKDTVFVVGGGDSAVEESLALAKFARRVVLLVRRNELRASGVMADRIKNQQNIEIWYRSEAVELIGQKRLEQVRITRDAKEQTIPADGLFYAIGHTPATQWLMNSGVGLDKKGYIKTHVDFGFGSLNAGAPGQGGQPYFPTMTSVPGIFAAGDCVDPRYRQAITAAGYGCMAALDAQRWIEAHR